MNDETNPIHIHHYEIRVDGYLSDSRACDFEGLLVTQLPNGETQISGPLEDQAALFGLLIRIRDMGIPLLSVNSQKHTISENEVLENEFHS